MKRFTMIWRGIVSLVAIIVIGLAGPTFAQASTSNISFEAEAGTLSGNTSVISDTTASSGSAIQFNQPPQAGGFAYPKSVSGRKILDQNGQPFLIKTMSSWAMAQNGSNADITSALESLANLGFNAVTVAPMGNYYNDDGGSGWVRYKNKAGQDFFTGTPLRSSFGPAWSSMDWVMQEATRLHMTVLVSVYTGYENRQGIGNDLIAAGQTNAYNLGHDLAARYSVYPNIVWHVGADWDFNYGTEPSRVLDAVFHGIRDVEGSNRRLQLAEPKWPRTSQSQFISQVGTSGYQWLQLDINSSYNNKDYSAVEIFDRDYNEAGATNIPIWDCEMFYRGAQLFGVPPQQEMREHIYSVFIRGASGLNYGDADFWPFNLTAFNSGGPGQWATALQLDASKQAGYAMKFVQQYMADTSWLPSNFIKSGVGSGSTKAAGGNSSTAAVAYFPSSRTVAVDTTILSGTGNVQLRWYDPTNGTYTTIAASESRSASRQVSFPANHADGTSDWVLVETSP